VNGRGHPVATKGSASELVSRRFNTGLTFQGAIDNALTKAGFAVVLGGDDADVDIGSNRTLHATTLVAAINKPFRAGQVSVAAITCPNVMTSFSVDNCTAQIVDNAGNDRPWITSDGTHVYISYHDAGRSFLVRVQRSDDDGFTWKRVGDAITRAGPTTGSSTFNNIAGPIKADPDTHTVYQVFAAGQVGRLKAKTQLFNDIFVSQSTDGGQHWTPVLVWAGPLPSTNVNIFPSVGVDPTNGDVFAVWSNASNTGTNVYFSASTNSGMTWSAPVIVNAAPEHSHLSVGSS
jgi:hypothetical protein